MEWLAKASDLLDKVDQLAAERLADEEDVEVADDDVLALLDAAEREDEPEAQHAPAVNAAAAAAAVGPPPSPRGELQRCVICGAAASRLRARARCVDVRNVRAFVPAGRRGARRPCRRGARRPCRTPLTAARCHPAAKWRG